MPPEALALSLSYLVARMHSLGLIHMDLKTCNIFVAQHELLVLGDLGMAKMVGSDGRLERHGRVFTTITHRAPELLMGMETIGPWNDVWSLGMILGQCMQRRVWTCSEMSEYGQLVRIGKMIGRPDPEEVGCDDLYLPAWPKRGAGEYFCKFVLSWTRGERTRRVVKEFLDECL
jgi:serine/threonine protein kinase